MNLPPALMAVFIPAGLFAAWLFMHKDADVEQRIDKQEAVLRRESAEFDRDFARMTGDKQAEKVANSRAIEAEKAIAAADLARAERAKDDQRGAVRAGVDEFLKPKSEENK